MSYRTFIIFLISVLALLTGYIAQNLFSSMQDEGTDYTLVGQQNSFGGLSDDPFAIKLLTLEQQEVSVKEFMDSEIVVLNFWATWCPPCVREIPAFIKLQNKYRGRGVSFLGVALDDAKEVSSFLLEMKLNYPVLIGDDRVIKMMAALGNSIGALPYTVVLNDDRQIVHTHRGEWSEELADEFLELQTAK